MIGGGEDKVTFPRIKVMITVAMMMMIQQESIRKAMVLPCQMKLQEERVEVEVLGIEARQK